LLHTHTCCPCFSGQEIQLIELCYTHTPEATKDSPSSLLHAPGRRTQLRLHQLRRTSSTSTSPCTATTRHPAAQALRQPRRAPRVLVSRPQRLYISFAVHRDYSSPDCTGSTSTLLCAAGTRLSAAATQHRLCRTPPRRRFLGVRLPRLLTSTSLNQNTSRGQLPRHQQLVGSTSN
jgi:hypothetical protein